MTQDDIIRVAVQCQLVTAGNRDGVYMDALTKFADLVAAAEREACAKVCDVISEPAYDGYESPNTFDDGKSACAEAIRARGNT